MLRFVTPLFLTALLAAPAFAQTCPTIETQVLRILVTKDSSYYHKPWKTPDFENSRASGFFFKDAGNFPGQTGLILTNAHAVSQSRSIRVSNGREKNRYPVKVVGICHTADFAILKMDPEDLANYEHRNGAVTPLELGDSDALRVGDKVLGWGYPSGGEGISKSDQGEISRIEVGNYSYSQDKWLMVQASLQQNRGNSGGPVLKDDKVVGISFQGMRDSDRLNFFIPINVVKRLVPLLNDQEKIPRWRFLVQLMFPGLKDYYNLGPDQGGVILDYIVPGGGPYSFGLRNNDILMTIDGLEIDNFGEVFLKTLDQKIFFSEALNRKVVGDPLNLTVIRDGKKIDLSGPMTRGLPKLVPKIFSKANYFICSGVAFVELTVNCIDNLGQAGQIYRAKYADAFPEEPYQKIVIVSEIFPEYGLADTTNYLKRVKKIAGEKVLNVEHLYNIIQSLRKQSKKKVLVELPNNVKLPLDIENSDGIDKTVQEKYGILYMKTPGGFTK